MSYGVRSVWCALEFVRSRRTGFRWYVLVTNGRFFREIPYVHRPPH